MDPDTLSITDGRCWRNSITWSRDCHTSCGVPLRVVKWRWRSSFVEKLERQGGYSADFQMHTRARRYLNHPGCGLCQTLSKTQRHDEKTQATTAFRHSPTSNGAFVARQVAQRSRQPFTRRTHRGPATSVADRQTVSGTRTGCHHQTRPGGIAKRRTSPRRG